MAAVSEQIAAQTALQHEQSVGDNMLAETRALFGSITHGERMLSFEDQLKQVLAVAKRLQDTKTDAFTEQETREWQLPDDDETFYHAVSAKSRGVDDEGNEEGSRGHEEEKKAVIEHTDC